MAFEGSLPPRCSTSRSSGPATTGSWRPPTSPGPGLSVECFERRDIAGGACVTEELWPGVRASPGRLHAVAAAGGDHPRARPGPPRAARWRCTSPTCSRPSPTGARWSPGPTPSARASRSPRDWSRRGRRRLRRVRGAPRGRGRPGAAADARAARPRALARGGRPRAAGRLGGRRAGGHPLRAGAGAVRDPGPDRHAGGAGGPGHRVRGALPRPRRGGRHARRVGLRARRHGRRDRRAALGRGEAAGASVRLDCAGASVAWRATAAPPASCSRTAPRCARAPCSRTPTRCAPPRSPASSRRRAGARPAPWSR